MKAKLATKPVQGGMTLPTKEALLAAMKVGESSVEGAEYLATRFKELLIDARVLDKSKDILATVEDYARFVRFKLVSDAQPWAGQAGHSTDFLNMQDHLAQNAAETLTKALKADLKLDIAISDIAQLLRGYSSNGKPMDPQLVDTLDVLFNSWLAKQDVVSKGSTLFEANEHGEIKTDEQGKQKPADAQGIRRLLDDPDKGFAQFLQGKGIQVGVTVQQHKYSEPRGEEEKRQEVEEVIKEGLDVSVGIVDAKGVQVESEAPKSGGGM